MIKPHLNTFNTAFYSIKQIDFSHQNIYSFETNYFSTYFIQYLSLHTILKLIKSVDMQMN